MSQDTHVVSVEILGLRYPIRSTLQPGYVSELAAYVDAKMQAAADETDAGDSVKIAVIAALNIADELFRTRDRYDPGTSPGADEIRQRMEAIERIVDRLLTEGASPLATPARSD